MSSISTQGPTPHLQLPNTFGALFMGVILAAVLFGATNVQAFIYFQTHSGTGITFYKLVVRLCCLLVIWLWMFDALHLILIVHCMYFYLVINYANIGALAEMVWSSKCYVLYSLNAFLIRSLYVHRIWTDISPLYQGVHTIADLVNAEWTLYMYVGTVAFVNILIASLLCYLLATSRTGFSRTDLFTTKLLSYFINTGCLTSMCPIAATITCAVMPKNYIFEAIEFFALKLHANSYIALLNVRYYAQPHADTMHTSEYYMRHDVYHRRLHVRASQDEEFKVSRKSIFKHPNDEVLHITRPVQAVMVNGYAAVDRIGLMTCFSRSGRLR
ncbi:hypothetical protein BDR05DRAFT_911825 [Suillus weaverae]|nr:hypothetical protein BDR05DRAFT_911825 [Suillus weaverae]